MQKYEPTLTCLPYEQDEYAEMEEEDCGEWVKYSDVQERAKELSAEWRKTLSFMSNKGEREMVTVLIEDLEKLFKD